MTLRFSILSNIVNILIINIMISVIADVPIYAQPAPIPFHKEPYSLESGIHEGLMTESVIAFRKVIQIDGAPWLQIHFSDYNLGTQSYIQITSLKDGGSQRFDTKNLPLWGNSTAYFNGDAVVIELHVAPGEDGIFFSISEITVGKQGGVITESICGTTDDRVPSIDPAVGRIVPVGCTGWIVSNGALLTAGHCNDGIMGLLQFNVPDSNSNGSINNPPPEDQYPIDQNSIIFNNGGIGNDWAIFRTFTNTNTNQLPVERQGAFYRASREAPLPFFSNVRITGYGADMGTSNQTEQTHVGIYNGEGQNGNNFWHGYGVDTTGGNSGSPIIWEGSSFIIGIHTTGGCDTGYENRGTSFEHDPLDNTLQNFPGTNTVYVDTVFQPPGWWPFWVETGSIFQPYNTVTEAVNVIPNGGIVSIVAGSYPEAITINKAVSIIAPVGAVTIGQ